MEKSPSFPTQPAQKRPEDLHIETARLANDFSEGLFPLDELFQRLQVTYWQDFLSLAQRVLERRAYFYDAKSLAYLTAAQAAVYLPEWDRKEPFLSWSAGLAENVLEEIDRGLGLEWGEVQEGFNPELQVPDRERRISQALNRLPFDRRRVAFAVLRQGISLPEAAEKFGFSLDDATEWLRDSLEQAHRWADSQETEPASGEEP